jgi:hypothetical protein
MLWPESAHNRETVLNVSDYSLERIVSDATREFDEVRGAPFLGNRGMQVVEIRFAVHKGEQLSAKPRRDNTHSMIQFGIVVRRIQQISHTSHMRIFKEIREFYDTVALV